MLYFEEKEIKEKGGKNSGQLMSISVNRNANAHADFLAGTDSTTGTIKKIGKETKVPPLT